MVDPKIWGEIPDEQIGESINLSNGIENAAGDEKTNIAQKDQLRILCLVQRTAGIEMIDATSKAIVLAVPATFALDLVFVVTGDIGEQVHWPTKELLADEVNCRGNGCLLGELVQLLKQVASARTVFRLGLGDKYHVSLHVTGGFVVLAMRNLPGKVWYQERGVAEEPDSVIENLAG